MRAAPPHGRSLAELHAAVTACAACPRLVAHCRAVAATKRRQYRDEEYWGRPVPGFGDARARILVVGLAPGAHGANRTGRVFTGDRSGDWLYAALHEVALANRAAARGVDDGLRLRNVYVTLVARCAPPQNRLTREEIAACRPFLREELRHFGNLRVVVVLGQVAMQGFLAAWRDLGRVLPTPRPRFSHGLRVELDAATTLLASYHPSQQNTFTGRLTRPMLRSVFRQAVELL